VLALFCFSTPAQIQQLISIVLIPKAMLSRLQFVAKVTLYTHPPECDSCSPHDIEHFTGSSGT
jgi:hypothetical protein